MLSFVLQRVVMLMVASKSLMESAVLLTDFILIVIMLSVVVP
jgi:hypothetical protein